MVKISNSSYENEIHRVDSPFNEDSKNIIFLAREVLISGERRPDNLRKWPKLGKPIVMQIREWSILIGNTNLYCQVAKSSHCLGFLVCFMSNYLLKNCKSQFQAKFCLNFAAIPSLNVGTFFKF